MEERLATRTVVLDEGKVAILRVTKFDYYKIPGGGVEDGEELLAAARREVLEETGCECEIVERLDRMITDIPAWEMRDISEGFVARVIGEKAETQFSELERERGFELIWVESLAAAIQLFEEHEVADASAGQLQKRDLKFLKMAEEWQSASLS